MKILRKMAQAVGFMPRDVVPTFVRTTDSGESLSQSSAMALSAVWACVNLISGTISSLPLTVYRRGADGVERVDRTHPLYRVLHDSPNFDQTALDFWDFAAAAVELWGNAYARPIRNSAGAIIALEPLPPDATTVKRGANGRLEYRWTKDGKTFTAADRDILHIRGPGGDPRGGMSTLTFGANAMATARAADRSAGTFFRNGAKASGVLTFEKWLSPEQRELAEAGFAEKFLGAANSGKPIILEGGTTWQQLSVNPDDAQLLETRSFSIEEVCRFFAVPPVMIGHSSKVSSWPSAVEQQVLMFMKFTLRRRIKRIEMAIEQQLLSPEDRAEGVSVRFNVEGLLRADSAGRSTFYRTMTQIGAMTINEVRELEGLPPVEGGEVPRIQMQNQPINADPENANAG